MAGTVNYEVILRVREAIASAIQLGKSFAGLQQAATRMGGGVEKAEASIASMARSLSSFVGQAWKAQEGFLGIGKAAERSASQVTAAHTRMGQRIYALESAARGRMSHYGMGALGTGGVAAYGLWAGAHIGDKLVQRAASVDTMLSKIRLAVGGNESDVTAAYNKAIELSGTYQNTTVAENLKIMNDLRANLPETFAKIVNESAAPLVKLHSFYKAWEGGKHADVAQKSVEAIGAAIRSGELLGNATGEDLARHAEAIARGYVTFGDKYNVKSYFQGTQKAAAALVGASDQYKQIDFPILLQRLNQGGAAALQQINQRISGARLFGANLENFRALGLVNMDEFGPGDFNKQGKLKAGSALGKDWLRNSTEWRTNLTDAIFKNLVPALSQPMINGKANPLFVAGFKGQEISEAFAAGNIEKVTRLLTEARKTPGVAGRLQTALTGLSSFPTAQRALLETILGGGTILLHRQQYKGISDPSGFTSYDMAKQKLAAQADRFWQILTGRKFVPFIGAGLGMIANAFKEVGNAMQSSPMLRTLIEGAAAGAGIVAAGGLLGMLGRAIGLGGAGLFAGRVGLLGLQGAAAGVGAIVSRFAVLNSLLRMFRMGAALAIAPYVLANWNNLGSIVGRIHASISAIVHAMKDWWGNTDAYKKRMDDAAKAQKQYEEETKKPGYKGPLQRMFPQGLDTDLRDFLYQGLFGHPRPPDSDGRHDRDSYGPLERMRQSMLDQKIDIRASEGAPIKVLVEVHGRLDAVQGQGQGSGQVPLAVTHTRGQAMPSTGGHGGLSI
jgi:hypothetical protein